MARVAFVSSVLFKLKKNSNFTDICVNTLWIEHMHAQSYFDLIYAADMKEADHYIILFHKRKKNINRKELNRYMLYLQKNCVACNHDSVQ